MMEHTFDIFWDDLTPEAQARYRESEMTPPEEMNWETFPMATLYDEDEVEEEEIQEVGIPPRLIAGHPVVDEIKQYKETHKD